MYNKFYNFLSWNWGKKKWNTQNSILYLHRILYYALIVVESTLLEFEVLLLKLKFYYTVFKKSQGISFCLLGAFMCSQAFYYIIFKIILFIKCIYQIQLYNLLSMLNAAEYSTNVVQKVQCSKKVNNAQRVKYQDLPTILSFCVAYVCF